MALSKKRYEQFAQRIAETTITLSTDSTMHFAEVVRATRHVEALAQRLAVDFALDNPRFDRERFLKACGF